MAAAGLLTGAVPAPGPADPGRADLPDGPAGEHGIFERIKAISADRITIVVTHRLENTRIADHIVLMEHGRITESGTYDTLVHAGGTFADLLRLSQER